MATIKEIKEHLATIHDLDHPLFEELNLDGRSGDSSDRKAKNEIQKRLDED